MFHCGSRQCGFKTDAANPHQSSWKCCRTDGQEYNDEEGNKGPYRQKSIS